MHDSHDNKQRRKLASAIESRYEIADSSAHDLVECATTRAEAFAVARRLADQRGHRIEVCDRMARRGAADTWIFDPR